MSFNRSLSKRELCIVKTLFLFFLFFYLEYLFFRNIIGTDRMIGDRGDGRLTMLITEHWFQAFCGKVSLSYLPIFMPETNALGYSDLFLGYGLVHSVLRAFGLDMYHAFQMTLVLIHAFGTLSMYWLLKRQMQLKTSWSVWGTIAFCYAESIAHNLYHTQILAVVTMPMLLGLAIGFVRHFRERKKRNIYAFSFIFSFVLLAYTGWYTAFFTGLFCLVLIVFSVIRMLRRRVKMLPIVKNWLHELKIDLVLYFAALVLLFIPFLLLYIPVIKVSSGYEYLNVVPFQPELLDLINVSPNNSFMGWLPMNLYLPGRRYSAELEAGFTVFLLFLFPVLRNAYRKHFQNSKNVSQAEQIIAGTADGCFWTVWICLLLMIRLGSNGESLWRIVYSLVPISHSIRAIVRMLTWLHFPMAVLTAYYGDRVFRAKLPTLQGPKQKLLRVGVCLLSPVMFLFNLDSTGITPVWSMQEEKEYISTVPAPPEDAACFYLLPITVDAVPQDDEMEQFFVSTVDNKNVLYQVDAFEIATVYNLPTINGYSGQSPNGWGYIGEIGNKEPYMQAVCDWIDRHGLNHVYAYDIANSTWIPHEELSSQYAG